MKDNRFTSFFLPLLLILLSVSFLGAETYKVVRGDTLYSIAGKYDVPIRELMSLNGIEDASSLGVGMVLNIPGTDDGAAAVSTDPVYYTVVKGDTYYSISRAHGLDVATLLAMNGLESDDILSIGHRLKVGTSAPGSAEPRPNDNPAPASNTKPASATSSDPHLVFGSGVKTAATPAWPVSGKIFPVEGDFEGVMIESIPSSYVEAVSDGEVVWAGPYWEFGEIVLINSNDYIYFYGGNSDIFVNVGQKVSVGTRLGRLENIDGRGNLYFTVFKEGKVIDLARAGN